MIEIRNVHVTYPVHGGAPKKVLSGINLEIHSGEFIAVVGQTGCGKSTLLRLILGQELPTEGDVLIEGRVIDHPDRHRGYVPQKYSLFPDKTVLENIVFGLELEEFGLFDRWTPRFFRRRKQFETEAFDYLKAMGLQHSDGRKYPDQLSGGMQQRVAIAQALIMKPSILLMDEAFSALDPATRREMQRLIRRVWKEFGTTILFVTHNTAEAVYLGTRVIALGKANGDSGSKVALDVAVPAHDSAEEVAGLVRYIEENSVVGEESTVEEYAG
jgi:NitT/TauT family transport system ATP-binding protein